MSYIMIPADPLALPVIVPRMPDIGADMFTVPHGPDEMEVRQLGDFETEQWGGKLIATIYTREGFRRWCRSKASRRN
jgi:hypothetical protein